MKISTKANRKVREAVVKIFFARNGVKQLCLIEDLPQLPDIDFEGLRAVDKKISFNVLQRFDAPDFEIPGIVYNMNEFDGNKEEKVCIRKEGECPNYNCQKMAKSTLLRF
jgi:hypothetical protein